MTARRSAHLVRDQRGAVYAEFVIVIMPLMALALGIFQLTQLYTGRSALDHAAVSAARSAIVVFPDDPRLYGGEPVNTLGSRRVAAVRLAALRAMAPSVLDGNVQTADISFPAGLPTERGEPILVELRATFRCRVPLVARVVCTGSGRMDLVSRASLPTQLADFQY